MSSGLRFNPGIFVKFLNRNHSDACRSTPLAHFDLVSLPKRRRRAKGIDRYNIVYDNMVGGVPVDVCASIRHSVGPIMLGNRRNKVVCEEERVEIGVLKKIILSNKRILLPQRLVLRHLSREDEGATGLFYLEGSKQLDYRNGTWWFAD